MSHPVNMCCGVAVLFNISVIKLMSECVTEFIGFLGLLRLPGPIGFVGLLSYRDITCRWLESRQNLFQQDRVLRQGPC